MHLKIIHFLGTTGLHCSLLVNNISGKQNEQDGYSYKPNFP